MKDETKYSYQKRIKDLERDLFKAESDLSFYKNVATDIYKGILDMQMEGKEFHRGWILKQFGRLWR